MHKKILLTANTTWCLYNFRYGLIVELLKEQYDVKILAPYDKAVQELEKMGCKCHDIEMDGKNKNPLKELILLRNFKKEFRKIKPDIILAYTIKPNIYGSIAARILGVPIINNITGLGSVFIKKDITTLIAKQLYRVSLKKSAKVFFQNNDDFDLFLKNSIVKKDIADVLPGSGVNVDKFSPKKKKVSGSTVTFLLIARMLWDKGVGEYIEAARIIKKEYNNVCFQLLGKLAYNNPTAIQNLQMEKWTSEGIVQYLGTSSDVRQEIFQADCIVLPSYREGTSRVLLESASMGKPIITTDVPGCNNIVKNDHNGYLCKVRDSVHLAAKIRKFLSISDEARTTMGNNGRKRVLKEFDEKIVVTKYLEEIISILK